MSRPVTIPRYTQGKSSLDDARMAVAAASDFWLSQSNQWTMNLLDLWSQDPEWINRQLAYYGGGFGGVQDIEAPIVAMELQRKLGQNQGDPSLFLPEYLAPQLDNTVNVFVQSLRRIEQGLESQGIA